jgi:hypothetical protein
MTDVILGRKATEQEQELINEFNTKLAELGLEIYAIGAPNPKKKT